MNTPPRKAVALRYRRQQDSAPRIVAKGSGLIAQRMIEVAAKTGVQVYPDPQLTEALMSLELDSVIPEELYAVVAEVLAFVYRQSR